MNIRHLQTLTHLSDPIGIFDSGIGGLSIAQCIAKQLPNENLLYLADSAYAPYGELSIEAISKRVALIAHWLVKQHCKALVVACNTATVNVIDQLRKEISVPIIGVEPAIKPAAKQSKNKKVAILATQATAKNQRFLTLVEQYKNGSEVFIQPCPGLVELIEQGLTNSLKCKELLEHYLLPLLTHGVDTLVLGCTHYPFALSAIRDIVGNEIEILETSIPVTQQLIRQLQHYQLITRQTTSGKHSFYSSLATAQQQTIFQQLWQTKLTLLPF